MISMFNDILGFIIFKIILCFQSVDHSLKLSKVILNILNIQAYSNL